LPALPRQHAAQRILQANQRVRLIDQHALSGIGVAFALAQRSGQLGLQDVGEFLRFERAHTCQWQGPGLAQVLHHTLRVCSHSICTELGRHMLQFVIE